MFDRTLFLTICICDHKCSASCGLIKYYKIYDKSNAKALPAISISAFCYVRLPSCHPERSPPEIPPSLCSVLLRSSTTLRFAQNDTADAAEPARAMRSIGIYEGERMLFSPEILLDFVLHCFAVRLRLRSAQDDTGGSRFAEEYVFN